MKVARFAVAVAFGISLLHAGAAPAPSRARQEDRLPGPDSRSPRYETQDRPVFQPRCSRCAWTARDLSQRNGDSARSGSRPSRRSPRAPTSSCSTLLTAPPRPPSSSPRQTSCPCGHVRQHLRCRLLRRIDEAAIGALQASALLAAMKAPAKPTIVMLHGDRPVAMRMS